MTTRRSAGESVNATIDTMANRLRAILVLATCTSVVLSTTPSGAQHNDYFIGPQDGLAITVWNQADLGGTYTVEADGTFAFPLIGRVTAGGQTLREFEAELVRLLADGFFVNPQVSVAVEAYRSQRIFVVGEVRNPGTYPLTGGMTLIEALAGAGSTTAAASNEVLIVPEMSRSTSADAGGRQGEVDPPGESGPRLPGDADDENVISIDIEALQSGGDARNVVLLDGATVFVPRAETIYVFGEVTSPGEFPLRRATTVLQALALAGGVTEFGATNRVKVIRVLDGVQEELRVKLSDLVQAGDTIVVPERIL